MVKEDTGRSPIPFCETCHPNRRKPAAARGHADIASVAPQQNGSRRLSEIRCRKVRTHTRACFAYAVDEELLQKDPARKLVMPNIKKKSCERFLSVDELQALLSQASPREHVVLRILAVCGLRPAEILVLRIEDFEGTQLRIDEALKERQKGEDRIGETKTAESDNYVPVPPDLAREIATLIAGHPDQGNPRAFLFPNSDGGAFGVGNYLKRG